MSRPEDPTFSLKASQSPQSNPPLKSKFTPEEDTKLVELVTEFGDSEWDVISFLHGSRSPRQCRERYRNYLAPTLRADPWTPQEDELLLRTCAEQGQKWHKVAAIFQNRSENAVRNRWNVLHRKIVRPWKRAGLTLPPPQRPSSQSQIPRPAAPSVPPILITVPDAVSEPPPAPPEPVPGPILIFWPRAQRQSQWNSVGGWEWTCRGLAT
jgi:hypothetical protein